MRLDDIDKDKVIKFPGRSPRDVSEERAKFSDLINVWSKLAIEKEKQPERSQAIVRRIKTEYSELMARFVSQILYLLELKGDQEQFLDLVMGGKWDKVRNVFLENHMDIIRKIRGILKNSTKAKAAELGIRIIK